jgi:hypothetical protein
VLFEDDVVVFHIEVGGAVIDQLAGETGPREVLDRS